jgi:hypothetical protein
MEEREVLMRDKGSLAATGPSVMPFGNGGAALSVGDLGCEKDPNIALPSSESASTRSGGRRSFSISDLRLRENFGS